MHVLNALTPEDERATHYFWGLTRDIVLDDPTITELGQDMNRVTFAEDVTIMEQQQVLLETAAASWRPIAIGHDGGLVQAERMMRRLLAAEHASTTGGDP